MIKNVKDVCYVYGIRCIKNNKMSKNHADVCGFKNPLYGKKHTKESREKMRKSSQKLVKIDIIKIRQYLKDGITQSRIAEKFNIHPNTVSNIKTGKNYKDIK